MSYGGEGACDLLWSPRRRKDHALHADAVLQGRKMTLGVADGSIHHRCAKTQMRLSLKCPQKHLLLQNAMFAL